jgi:hypothetical protein
MLMGYKGDSYMDSGYFYCPYVPLTQTPVVLDPESFCPRKGILTRYGKNCFREFYARMSIAKHVDHIFPIQAFLDHGILDLKTINALDNLRPMLGPEKRL